MRIAVFGATGDQGAAQVRALFRAGHQPIAISRTPRKWMIDGVEIEGRAADFGQPDSLITAIQGADAVFLNLPSTSFQAADPLIAAARVIAQAAADSPSAGSLIFNTSLPVLQEKLGFAAQDARHEMRRHIFAANVSTVSIQPVVFLDNLLKGWAWPPIATRDTIVYAHDEQLDVSWICHDDLASLMIAAVERPHLDGRSFAVGGRDTVRLPELTRKLARAWHRPLRYESQSVDAFCEKMRRAFKGKSSLEAAQLVEELRRIYIWYNTAREHPFKVDMGPVLKELPVTLTPIESWAERQILPETPDNA